MTSLSSIHDRICIRHGGEECRNHLDTYLSMSIQAGYFSTIEDSPEDSIWDRDTIVSQIRTLDTKAIPRLKQGPLKKIKIEAITLAIILGPTLYE